MYCHCTLPVVCLIDTTCSIFSDDPCIWQGAINVVHLLMHLFVFVFYSLNLSFVFNKLPKRYIFFSSPEHMVLRMSFCDRLSSIVRACVRQQLLKQHLPFNHLSNFNETLQECSLHDALPKLFKEL